MKQIVIDTDGAGYQARLLTSQENNPWCSGVTVREAIGNLVESHPEQFNVTIALTDAAQRQRQRKIDNAIDVALGSK